MTEYTQYVADSPESPADLVGKVLVSSWGYDQTNIDFYMVTKATAKTITFTEIPATRDEKGYLWPNPEGTWYGYGQPEEYKGKRAKFYGGKSGSPYAVSVKITSYRNAHLWSGKPQADTTTYGGGGH